MTDYGLLVTADAPANSSADNPVTLGVEWYVTGPAWLKALQFWRADTAITGPVTGAAWTSIDPPASGDLVPGSEVTFALTGTGLLQATLTTPAPLSINQRYRAACHFPNGYSATGGYWRTGPGSNGLINGPLRAPNEATATANAQGWFGYGATLAYPPNGSPNGASYWVGVVVTDTSPAPDPPTETFTGHELATRWHGGELTTRWTCPELATRWTDGLIS